MLFAIKINIAGLYKLLVNFYSSFHTNPVCIKVFNFFKGNAGYYINGHPTG